jgi:hypothetical protein
MAIAAAPGRRGLELRITMPEETLLGRRLEALGLAGVRQVRVTDNRSVMVSLSPERVLRIHRGYAKAPDRVLRAVVRFLAPRTARAPRRAAAQAILAFPAVAHADGPPLRRRSPERPRPGDSEKVERLSALFRELNARHFAGRLPDVPIRVSGRMSSRLGQLSLTPDGERSCEIGVSRRHIEVHSWEEVAHTLLHEMVHLWQVGDGQRVDHGPRFRAKARAVGVTAAARRWVRPAGRGRPVRST